MEIIFYFDYFFGDSNVNLDEEINIEVLGFVFLVAIVIVGKVEVDMEIFKKKFFFINYEKFMVILFSLGYVGEGYCDG